jgi:predicted DNA-binding protein
MSARLVVRIPRSVNERLKEKAKQKGFLTVSEYVRNLILTELEDEGDQ